MFDRPKPWYVGTEFYLASHWTGDSPAVILSPVYFQKIKRWRFTSSINYSFFSLPHFLHYENVRNAVSGNPNFLTFSRGSMPPDPPRGLHIHDPHAPPPPPPPRKILSTRLTTLSGNKFRSVEFYSLYHLLLLERKD